MVGGGGSAEIVETIIMIFWTVLGAYECSAEEVSGREGGGGGTAALMSRLLLVTRHGD